MFYVFLFLEEILLVQTSYLWIDRYAKYLQLGSQPQYSPQLRTLATIENKYFRKLWHRIFVCPLTNSFIYAVEKITATLSVFNLVVEQLDKERDDGESSCGGSVVLLPGQDVQSTHGAFHNLLHPHSPCQRRSQKPAVPVPSGQLYCIV